MIHGEYPADTGRSPAPRHLRGERLRELWPLARYRRKIVSRRLRMLRPLDKVSPFKIDPLLCELDLSQYHNGSLPCCESRDDMSDSSRRPNPHEDVFHIRLTRRRTNIQGRSFGMEADFSLELTRLAVARVTPTDLPSCEQRSSGSQASSKPSRRRIPSHGWM
jgi:hypothetical protein